MSALGWHWRLGLGCQALGCQFFHAVVVTRGTPPPRSHYPAATAGQRNRGAILCVEFGSCATLNAIDGVGGWNQSGSTRRGNSPLTCWDASRAGQCALLLASRRPWCHCVALRSQWVAGPVVEAVVVAAAGVLVVVAVVVVRGEALVVVVVVVEGVGVGVTMWGTIQTTMWGGASMAPMW